MLERLCESADLSLKQQVLEVLHQPIMAAWGRQRRLVLGVDPREVQGSGRASWQDGGAHHWGQA